MSETDLQRAILVALEARGYWAIRINAGSRPIAGTEGHGRRMIRLAPPGTPDVLVIRPYCWLEVKTNEGRVNDAQRSWHARAERDGVRVRIVRSIGEALRYVDRCARDDGLRGRIRLCPHDRCPLEDSDE